RRSKRDTFQRSLLWVISGAVSDLLYAVQRQIDSTHRYALKLGLKLLAIGACMSAVAKHFSRVLLSVTYVASLCAGSLHHHEHSCADECHMALSGFVPSAPAHGHQCCNHHDGVSGHCKLEHSSDSDGPSDRSH